MQTIDCLLRTNDSHVTPRRGVTPAELMVLRFCHDKGAGSCCISAPVDTGKALMEIPSDEPEGVPETRERTDQEEYGRLRSKYQRRSKTGGSDSSFMDELFPGSSIGTFAFPKTFAEIPERYRLPADIEIKKYVAPKKIKEAPEAKPLSSAQVIELDEDKKAKEKSKPAPEAKTVEKAK